MGRLKIKTKKPKLKGYVVIKEGDKPPKRPHIIVNEEGLRLIK